MIYYPLFAFFSALFAGLDFIRGLFLKTAQLFIVLKKQKRFHPNVAGNK
jgi:hypothetical protein